MKIKPEITSANSGEVLGGFNNYYDVSLNLNANIKSILKEISSYISSQSKELELENGVKRWFKHLPEFNATIETVEGYDVTCCAIYATREIKSEVVTDCDQPEYVVNPETLPFQITNDEVSFELLNAYESKEFTSNESDPRIIKVKFKGNVPLCEHCKGTGVRICSTCNGRGAVTCSCCGGTGLNPETHREIVSKDTYWVDGTLHERNSYSERRSQCPVCQGSGIEICESCGGQKSFPCDACDGTGKKDGATSAATVNKLYESYRLDTNSSILLDNNDVLYKDYPQEIQSQDSIIFFPNPEVDRKLECEDYNDKYLTEYLKDILKNSCCTNKNEYLVGFALEIKKIPEGLIRKITVTYDDVEFYFYSTGKKLLCYGGMFFTSISLLEELLKKYKKKI